MQNDPSTRDILTALLDFRDAVIARFESNDRRFDDFEYRMTKRFDSVDLRLEGLDRRISMLESRSSA